MMGAKYHLSIKLNSHERACFSYVLIQETIHPCLVRRRCINLFKSQIPLKRRSDRNSVSFFAYRNERILFCFQNSDIIGVCTFVEDVDTNCRYKRRKVHLVDESRAVLELWLRGHLSAFDNANNPVMVISNCTTRGPEGLRRVETTPSTSVKINPEIEETRRLKDWFNETGLKNFSSFKKVGAMVDNVNIMVVALK